MFIKSFALLFLTLDLAAASPLLKRDAATVLSDISTISTDLSTLDTAVRGFDGNIVNAVPIATDVTTVENDVKKAISDTDGSSAFGTAHSSSMVNALVSLEPSINKTLNDIVSKKPQFASAGLNRIVLQDIQSLRNLTSTLSSALQKKVTPSDASIIGAGTTALDGAFTSAIAAYSS